SSGDVVDKSREKSKDRTFEIGGHGREIAPLRRTVHETMCRLFSGPGDNYHTDRTAARAFGFPDIVVQGMLPICFVSELMTRAFGDGWHRGGKLDLRLVNVVWGSDVLSVRGRVREELPEGDKTRVVCDAWCEKPDGVKTLVGTASALR
ncbi:MAG: MaoC family dehydratase, partial [Alphaproteobacteria bacterium]